MKNTAFILLLGITTAAGSPAVAQQIAVTGADATPVGGEVASPQIQWEARWTGNVDTDAPDDASIAAEATNAAGGAPTPIIPTAYSAASGRPATLR